MHAPQLRSKCRKIISFNYANRHTMRCWTLHLYSKSSIICFSFVNVRDATSRMKWKHPWILWWIMSTDLLSCISLWHWTQEAAPDCWPRLRPSTGRRMGPWRGSCSFFSSSSFSFPPRCCSKSCRWCRRERLGKTGGPALRRGPGRIWKATGTLQMAKRSCTKNSISVWNELV